VTSRGVRGATRDLALTAVQTLLRLSLRVLSRVFPQSRIAVVSVFPDTEGNGLEVARALVRRYDGRVVWLLEGESPPVEVLALAAQGMVLVPKASLEALWFYLRAEVVFFTHGLFGSPRPCRRKPIVNLWHGDGPKQTRPDDAAGSLIPSTYLVGSTRLFSGYKARAFEVPRERLLVTGNPRTDQFWREVDRRSLEQLGITGEYVVWMPTFRRARAVGAVKPWEESVGAASEVEELEALLEGLRARSIQLVVKPHPMDADRRRRDGVVTVTEADLVRTGVSLYALLGQSAGLVTDYSSVWVDYLLLDRPVAFLVSDRETYTRRLVPHDVLDWLPGELVDKGAAPFARFLADVDAAGECDAVLRKEVATRLGLNPSRSAADDLVTELERRGVLPRPPS
jgi:hypothetical protein